MKLKRYDFRTNTPKGECTCKIVPNNKDGTFIIVEDLRALLEGATPLSKPPKEFGEWSMREKAIFIGGYVWLQRELLAELSDCDSVGKSAPALHFTERQHLHPKKEAGR